MTDKQLDQAARDYEQALLQALPGAPEHEFSPEFRERMSRLRPGKRLQPWLWQSACAVLALALCAGLLIPRTQAQGIGWELRRREQWVCYRCAGGTGPEQLPGCLPGWLPEGFALTQQLEMAGGGMLLYENQGKILKFSYLSAANPGGLQLQVGQTQPEKVQFAGREADLYAGSRSILVWSSDGGQILFCLAGDCSGEILIKIAKTIEFQG